MKSIIGSLVLCVVAGWPLAATTGFASVPVRHTVVSVDGDSFRINGKLTYEGRSFREARIEGLLFNARLVQGTFDDLNPETRSLWTYPDGKPWDPERNTNEFVAAMPAWRAHGLLAFTLNLQGGSPIGYGNKGWINTGFETDGALRPATFARLERILDRADELGMVVFLGLFYFGQDQTLQDNAAVARAAEFTIGWLHDRGYRNVIIEACNETTPKGYHHDSLRTAGVPALLHRLRSIERDGHRFLVGVSLPGMTPPTPEIVAESDVILIHGNNRKATTNPGLVRELIRKTRALPTFHPMPVVINEDDHYDFEAADSDLWAATEAHVSWGFFDFRREGESYADGFQSVPVDWTISSTRKRQFFEAVARITGAEVGQR